MRSGYDLHTVLALVNRGLLTSIEAIRILRECQFLRGDIRAIRP